MRSTITESVQIPETVNVTVKEGLFTIKGPKGEVQRAFADLSLSVGIKDNKVVFEAKEATKREKKMLFTIRAHLCNMMRGVVQPHTYKVKVCSGHFPMNIGVKGDELVVKNFLGEKYPRTLKLSKQVEVKFADNILCVSGCNLELVSQTAARMEQLTRITNRDRRVFQDGLYIIEKDGVAVD